MNPILVLQIIQTVTILTGVLVALVQLRQYHRSRERDSMLQLMHSFQTPEFSRGLDLLFGIPDGLNKRAVEEHAGARMQDLYVVFTTIESLGVLLYRGEVSLDLVDDFFSGSIVLCWSKCGKYFEEIRAENKRETLGEWIQWLAERMAEREAGQPPVPAHIAHRNWRPPVK